MQPAELLSVPLPNGDRGLRLLHQTPGHLGDVQSVLLKEAHLAHFLPAEPSDLPGVTLVMMSHSRKRWEGLLAILRKYRAMSILEEIVLIWNDPSDATAPEELRALNAETPGVQLRVVEARVNSMNNRFAIWKTLSTHGVIIQDDDLWVEEKDLLRLVDVWRLHPEQLVGAYMERDHFAKDSAGHLVELRPNYSNVDIHAKVLIGEYWGPEYSQVLPHPWVISKDYLRLYMESQTLAWFVDETHNCDDIYMNAVVANSTRAPPIAVDVAVHFFFTANDDSSMWNSDPDWARHRTDCLERVNRFYAAEPQSKETGTVWRVAQGSFVAEV